MVNILITSVKISIDCIKNMNCPKICTFTDYNNDKYISCKDGFLFDDEAWKDNYQEWTKKKKKICENLNINNFGNFVPNN